MRLSFRSFKSLGSDPELFFTRDGKVVPSSEVVPKESEFVTRDGFQLELHPKPENCRQSAAYQIAKCIGIANRYAKASECELNFGLGHVIHDELWKGTPNVDKRFGCSPTESAQEKNPKRVTGLRERFRAGAGHIHFALGYSSNKVQPENYDRLIQVMDIVLGNTCVLIDRDPLNVTRRKNYGRAGEYRVKPYGIEYRVPSNFWLRHYVLWSLVSQLGRHAMDIELQGYSAELIKRFDMRKVRKAINTNNYELALENYTILEQFIKDQNPLGTNGINATNLEASRRWLTSKNPMASFARTDAGIVKHWSAVENRIPEGYERFIARR